MKKENNYNCQFSLIVASKNSEKHIQNLINSFKEQTFKGKELIIIDSNSDDNTKKIIIKNQDIISKFISEPDRGICDAWNKGIEIAKGDWVIFFGADDKFFDKNVLKKVSKILDSIDEKCNIIYGKIDVISDTGFIIGTYGLPWEKIKNRFNSIMNIPHQGVFHRRTLFDIYGNFNINLKYAGDYDICARVFKKSKPVFIPNIIISKMMFGGQSSLASHSWRVLEDFRLVRSINGMQTITALWLWVFFKAVIKLLLSKIIGDNKTYWLIKLLRDKYSIIKIYF